MVYTLPSEQYIQMRRMREKHKEFVWEKGGDLMGGGCQFFGLRGQVVITLRTQGHANGTIAAKSSRVF